MIASLLFSGCPVGGSCGSRSSRKYNGFLDKEMVFFSKFNQIVLLTANNWGHPRNHAPLARFAFRLELGVPRMVQMAIPTLGSIGDWLGLDGHRAK